MASYNFTGALQYATLSQGTYTIAARGASGGSSTNGGSGGLGASAQGDFTFQSSTKLIFVVGGVGAGSLSNGGGGGGGGTFVFVDVDNDNAVSANDTLLLAAGGGGGGSFGPSGIGAGGVSATQPSGSGSGGAPGGTVGPGGGGAGVNGAGQTLDDGADPQAGRGAPNITSGGAAGSSFSFTGGAGGYGGGGGGGTDTGGGGGGYSGGAGGRDGSRGGSGGTSYIAPTATNTSSTGATNQGNGVASVTCFATGTRIGTARGAIAVEALTVGDRAVTASGEERPIRWIGYRTYHCRGRNDALPVRIAAHAFGEGRPARDLFVSPAHAICVDVLGEVLIPAGRLINGTTITQVAAKTVTYWHVELDSHDILLAEGLPAESYLDCGNRRFFANANFTNLHATPDARPEDPLPFCRPLYEDGPVVDLVRARLQERADALGWHKAALGKATGAVDRADRRRA